MFSRFSLNLEHELSQIYFYPLEDRAGFVSLNKLSIFRNHDVIELSFVDDPMYYFFDQSKGRLPIKHHALNGHLELELKWTYRGIHEHSRTMNVSCR